MDNELGRDLRHVRTQPSLVLETASERAAQQKFFDTLGKDMPRELLADHDRMADKFAK